VFDALLKLGETAAEEPSLGLGAGKFRRTLIGGASFVAASEPAQQVGARRMPVLVIAQVEPLDDLLSSSDEPSCASATRD